MDQNYSFDFHKMKQNNTNSIIQNKTDVASYIHT